MYPSEDARRHPDRLAFVMARTGEQMTFGEFDTAANRLAHLLRAQGLRSGDHVAFLMDNCLTLLVACGAAERAGLYYTPVDFHLTLEEAAHVVNNSAAELLVTNQNMVDVAAQLPSCCSAVKRWLMDTTAELPEPYERYADAVAEYPAEPIPDEDLGVAMLYSAGTTGRPAGIQRPIPGLDPRLPLPIYGRVAEAVYKMSADAPPILLQPGPLYHAGPQSSTALAVRMGGTTVIMDRFDARRFLELIGEYQVTHTVLVPTMMSRLLSLPDDVKAAAKLSSLRVLVHGAAPCPRSVKKNMIDWLGPIVFEYYGATEANGGTSVTAQEWLERPGTVGRPYIGELVIRADDGTELPTGATGQVWFRGATNFVYFGNEAKTAGGREADGSMSTTGDIGYVDDDGYLYLTDRQAFTIISGGVNVYPQEIENVLCDHPDVADVAVIAVPNADLGEEVKAIIALRPGVDGEGDAEARLIAYCRERLSKIKVPRSIDFVAEVPRTAAGKLNKRLLHDQYWKDH